MILILSEAGDLHALTVAERLIKGSALDVAVVETNRPLAMSAPGGDPRNAWVIAADGRKVTMSDVELVWARRVGAGNFLFTGDTVEPDHQSLIRAASRATVSSLLRGFSNERVLNPLVASWMAEDKLAQLQMAQSLGARVPRTILSSDPEEIAAFADSLPGGVISKPLQGVRGVHLFVAPIDISKVTAGDMGCCVLLYQEAIGGDQHYRVNVFGDDVVAFRITSPHFDWRLDYSVPMEPTTLSDATRELCVQIVAGLGLRMGVLDFKLSSDGDPVFLEVNPQGQFLFLEAISGVDLRGACASFLLQELQRVRGGSLAADAACSR